MPCSHLELPVRPFGRRHRNEHWRGWRSAWSLVPKTSKAARKPEKEAHNGSAKRLTERLSKSISKR